MKKFWWVAVVVGIGVSVMSGCSSSGVDEPAAEPVAAEEQPQAPPVEDTEKSLVNTLKWTTASEVDNFGFDIYRSLSEDGPFERITAEPMPGAGTTDEPQKYVFVDDTNDPTKDYYIESITLGGVRENFSPIIKAAAKHPVTP